MCPHRRLLTVLSLSLIHISLPHFCPLTPDTASDSGSEMRSPFPTPPHEEGGDPDPGQAYSPPSPLRPPPFRPPSFSLRPFVSEPLAEYSPSGRIVDPDADGLREQLRACAEGDGEDAQVVKDALDWSLLGRYRMLEGGGLGCACMCV